MFSEQFENACYTSPLAAAKSWRHCLTQRDWKLSLKRRNAMADWLIKHIPQTTEQFLILRSEADGVEAVQNNKQEAICFDT